MKMIHKTKKRSLDEANQPAKCNGKVVLEESNNGIENSGKKKKLKVNPLTTTESKANKRRSQDEVEDPGHPHNVKKKKKKKKNKHEDPQTGSVNLKQVESKTNVTEQASPTAGIGNKSLKELKKEKKKLLKLLKNEKLDTTSESKSKSDGVPASTDASLLKKLKKKNKKNKKFGKSEENTGDLDVPKKVQKEQIMQLKEIKHSLKGSNVIKNAHNKKGMQQNPSSKREKSGAPKVEFLSEKLKKASLKQLTESKNPPNSDSCEPLLKDNESAKIDAGLRTSPSSAQESKNKKKKKNKKKEKAGKEEGERSKKDNLRNSNDTSSKPVETKKSKDKVISTKRKEFFKKKREQFKESKKLLKLQAGESSGSTSSDNMSLEQIKEKISELQNRETLSNTAKRKLRVLKKKAEVLQSSENRDQVQEHKGHDPSEKITGDIGKKAKKLKKNASVGDKKDSNIIIKNSNKASPSSEVHGKKKKEAGKIVQEALFVEDREGDVSLKIAQSKKNDNRLPISSSKKNTSKLTNGSGQGSESISDDEDGDVSGTKDYLSNVLEQVESENSGHGSSDEGGVDSEDQDDEEDDDSLPVAIVSQSKAPKTQSPSSSSKNQNRKVEMPGKKQRYVLFVGNLSYDSTTVDLKKHFLTKVDRVKDVRIPLAPGTNKPRGFAYVEVENSEDYEKGLSLHGSFLRGRPLKVEYTTSGSKAAGKRKEIVHKNKKLHAMRKAGMLAGSKKKRNFKKDFKKTQEKSQD